MSEKPGFIYTSGLNDPTTWETEDEGVIHFASNADARKAAALLTMVQDKAFNDGVEAAAKLVDERYDECEPWIDGKMVRALKLALPH